MPRNGGLLTRKGEDEDIVWSVRRRTAVAQCHGVRLTTLHEQQRQLDRASQD